MATQETGTLSSQTIIREGAARVQAIPRTVTGSYKYAAITGTIAAALAANSSVFASRLDPGAGVDFKVLIESIRLRWITIVAFTTAITAGRRLGIFRGTGAAPTGGTQLTILPPIDSNHPASEMVAAQGGETRIATTGALGVAGITFEVDPFELMSLVHVGAAGAFAEIHYEYNAAHDKPLILRQGELWAIRNPAAMDAAGTWQLQVDVEHSEFLPAIF